MKMGNILRSYSSYMTVHSIIVHCYVSISHCPWNRLVSGVHGIYILRQFSKKGGFLLNYLSLLVNSAYFLLSKFFLINKYFGCTTYSIT